MLDGKLDKTKRTHVLVDGKIYKIYSYEYLENEKYFDVYYIKNKVNKFIFIFSSDFIGTPREIFNYLLKKYYVNRYVSPINKLALRYLRRFYPQDLIRL